MGQLKAKQEDKHTRRASEAGLSNSNLVFFHGFYWQEIQFEEKMMIQEKNRESSVTIASPMGRFLGIMTFNYTTEVRDLWCILLSILNPKFIYKLIFYPLTVLVFDSFHFFN